MATKTQALAGPGAQWGQDQGYTGHFNRVVVIDDGGFGRGLALLALGFLLAVGGLAAYVRFVEDKDPIDAAEHFFDESIAPLLGLDIEKKSQAPNLFNGAKTKAKPKMAEAPAPKPVAIKKTTPVIANPYQRLPNAILERMSSSGAMSASDEDQWRAGLSHKFSYQHWKTVMEMRSKRLRGTEALYTEALEDKKLWVRMWAAVGLAELNEAIAPAKIKDLIKNEQSELVADFFERLEKKSNPAQRYFMRAALRVVDDTGRLSILKALARSSDSLRDLYLTAAVLDPSPKVHRWILAELRARPIEPNRYNDFLDVVAGKKTPPALPDGAILPEGSETPSATKPDPEVAPALTEEQLDEELRALEVEARGDVTIFDEKAPTEALETIDAETFEYKD